MASNQGVLSFGRRWKSLNPQVIQRQQLFNLFCLFLAGKLILNFPITWLEIASIVVVAITIDHALILLRTGKLGYFSYSAVNCALGVIFLLRATDAWIYVAMVALALVQKHVITINGRHFLNPSNVAVVFGLTLFPYTTYTTPEQWGTFWWLGGVMMVLGLLVLYRVDRYLIAVTFAASYAAFTYLFITHSLMQILYTVLSGSFLLFMLFMMTDPRTTPGKLWPQILFGTSVAGLAILLELLFGARQSTMFVALFAMSLLRGLWMVRDKAAVLRAGGAVAATVAALATSPFLSTSQAWFTPAFDLDEPRLTSGPSIARIDQIAWDTAADLYQTDWQESFVVSRPLQPEKRDKGFAPGPSDFSAYQPKPELRHAGNDYAYHAPVAAGDINHDGFLDIAFGQLNRPVSILLSDGSGGFSDATHLLFDGPAPFMVDNLALADFDNDGYLDLLVIPNPYEPNAQPNTLYLFDRDARLFRAAETFPLPRRSTTGGIAVTDINGDSILDFYLTFNHDWQQDKPPLLFFRSDSVPNQFWVSGPDGWSEMKDRIFPTPREDHAGMTAVFSDIDGDGITDFLIGNDMQPNLTYLGDGNGNFGIIAKERIEYNADASMGYIPADFDNDGQMEIWEHGISYPPSVGVTRYGEQIGSLYANLLSPLRFLQQDTVRKTDLCDFYPKSGELYAYCAEIRKFRLEMRKGKENDCAGLINTQRRKHCSFYHSDSLDPSSPFLTKVDAENFPRKVPKNVLLDQSSDGRFSDILGQGSAALTKWTWAAYPFDMDNDGFLDIYVTNGFPSYSVRPSRFSRMFERSALLMNHGTTGQARLTDMADAYGIDLVGMGRGAIVADFDGDGDGDVFENRLLKAPAYMQNAAGGDAIVVELRSKSGNYFGLGARVILHLRDGQKTRDMMLGGIWDSSAPPRIHFGLDDKETPVELEIRWSNGTASRYPAIDKNNLYVLYE